MTQNDYIILKSLLDDNDDDKGVQKIKGTTIKEIIDKTNLSRSKIGATLTYFIDSGIVEYGLSIKNAKSFIVTQNGIEKLLELKGEDDDE